MWKMALGERVLLRKIERGRGIVRISLKGDQRGSKDALNIAFLSLSFPSYRYYSFCRESSFATCCDEVATRFEKKKKVFRKIVKMKI